MQPSSTPSRVLVVRNDKLGDFVLSLPAIALLKRSMPYSHVAVLVPEYTRELASACPWIDCVVLDPVSKHLFGLCRDLRDKHFDAVVALFSTTRVGVAGLLARIPVRVAPATKVAQLFFNQRLAQHRSESAKPEYIYNIELMHYFLGRYPSIDVESSRGPYLDLGTQRDTAERRTRFCELHRIPLDAKIVFMHVGSGGSAANLSVEQYAILGQELSACKRISLVLTCGPADEERVAQVATELRRRRVRHVVYHSSQGLLRFAQQIQFTDLFVGGSTGPLHLAAALDVPTLAFYPRRRSASALRWQTLNSPERRLAFSPPPSAEEADMSGIDVRSAASDAIENFIQRSEGHIR